MEAFVIQNIAPIMFIAMIGFLLLGYPIAFALGACGLFFGAVGIYLNLLSPQLFQALPDNIWRIMSNESLLAIPFFTLMGLILERSGMAEDLLETVGQLFGPIRGGLTYAVILVGAMLAATTGVVAASVISMGLISLPIMLRYGYDKRLASGTIAASGTLAQIIPPSLVLIIMADQLGTPVSEMYKGAILPGLCLTGLYIIYVFALSITRPKLTPALPPEARNLREANGSSGVSSLLVLMLIAGISAAVFAHFFYQQRDTPLDEKVVEIASVGALSASLLALLDRMFKLNWVSLLAQRVTFALIPPLLLIFLVLGTIFLGIATPTEGGAMGACGALIMALVRRRLSFQSLNQALHTTAQLTTFVIFILVGSRVFSLAFYGVNGHLWVENLLLHLPGGQVGFLLTVNILIFLLAFFLDFFELSFIVVPLLAPVAAKLGINLIWFGVLLGVNMQTSFMHPPFGFALCYLRSVAPKAIKTSDIYWGAIPFVGLQLLMVGLLIAFPQIVTWNMEVKPKIDLDKVEIEIPTNDFGNSNTEPPDLSISK